MTPKKLTQVLDLAILANGGEEFLPTVCECEPETNNAPCRYCAIYDGLKLAKQSLTALEQENAKLKTDKAIELQCMMEERDNALQENAKLREVVDCGRELMNYAKVVVLNRAPQHGLHNLANALNRFDAAFQRSQNAANSGNEKSEQPEEKPREDIVPPKFVYLTEGWEFDENKTKQEKEKPTT